MVRSSPGRTAEPKARNRQLLSSGITLRTVIGVSIIRKGRVPVWMQVNIVPTREVHVQRDIVYGNTIEEPITAIQS